MALSVAKDPTLVKDGRRTIRIRGLTDLASYPRQRLKQEGANGKAVTSMPVDAWFKDIRPGIGVVSRNVELTALETATEHSYRKTERIMDKKFGRETIRQEVLKTGEKARELPASRREERIIPERKLKDAADQTTSYRKSAGSSIRQRIGALLGLKRVYLLIDGIHVFQKEKGTNSEESRECKVGVILCQNNEKISEIAAWCTWGRIRAFRALTQAAWLATAAFLNIETVIVSDGAKWIRNMRKWIPGLAHAIWILDWFHLADRLLKCLSVFLIEKTSATAQTIINLLWRGRVDEAAQAIKELPMSADTEQRDKETAAVRRFLTYLNNQREGIVDYEEYQSHGYIVGSGYVEKLNDTLIKDRMVRGKRMRWSLRGGEAMMALLTAKHNGRLAEVFV